METRTDVDPDEVRTDIDTPSDEGLTRPVRIVPAHGTRWLSVTLNPACPTCGQPLPRKP